MEELGSVGGAEARIRTRVGGAGPRAGSVPVEPRPGAPVAGVVLAATGLLAGSAGAEAGVPPPDAAASDGHAAPSADGIAAAAERRPAVRDTLVEGRYRGPSGSRRYRLQIPEGPAPEGGRPLVVMLHGCTQDAADFAAGTEMSPRAGEEGWLVLYPEQSPEAHPQRCWRWYEPEHQSAGSGEPALLSGMVDRMVRERTVDPERIYLAGLSAGGAMAAVLAATDPTRYAAVAVHSGVPYAAARGGGEARTAMQGNGPKLEVLIRRLEAALDDRPPPPLLVVHGEEDRAVPPVNGLRLAAAWLAAAGRPPAEDREAGPALPAADRDEIREEGPGRPWRLRVWEGSAPVVELRTVEGLGHAWSGGSEAGTYTDPAGPSATAWVVDFFRSSGRTGAGRDGGDRRPRGGGAGPDPNAGGGGR